MSEGISRAHFGGLRFFLALCFGFAVTDPVRGESTTGKNDLPRAPDIARLVPKGQTARDEWRARRHDPRLEWVSFQPRVASRIDFNVAAKPPKIVDIQLGDGWGCAEVHDGAQYCWEAPYLELSILALDNFMSSNLSMVACSPFQADDESPDIWKGGGYNDFCCTSEMQLSPVLVTDGRKMVSLEGLVCKGDLSRMCCNVAVLGQQVAAAATACPLCSPRIIRLDGCVAEVAGHCADRALTAGYACSIKACRDIRHLQSPRCRTVRCSTQIQRR